jgi:hypothetical protein
MLLRALKGREVGDVGGVSYQSRASYNNMLPIRHVLLWILYLGAVKAEEIFEPDDAVVRGGISELSFSVVSRSEQDDSLVSKRSEEKMKVDKTSEQI